MTDAEINNVELEAASATMASAMYDKHVETLSEFARGRGYTIETAFGSKMYEVKGMKIVETISGTKLEIHVTSRRYDITKQGKIIQSYILRSFIGVSGVRVTKEILKHNYRSQK